MKTIYYLYDNRDGIPKYVGATGNTLNKRLACHKCSKGKSKRELWIQSIKQYLEIKGIESVEDNECLNREEYWINFYFESLVNLRIGNKASKELRDIFSKAQKGKPINWEALKKTHDKTRGVKKSKSWGENLKLKMTGVPKSKESVAKMKKHHTEKYGVIVYIDNIKYDSIREAQIKTGIPRTTIKLYLDDKVKKKKYNISSQIVAGQ